MYTYTYMYMYMYIYIYIYIYIYWCPQASLKAERSRCHVCALLLLRNISINKHISLQPPLPLLYEIGCIFHWNCI